MFNLLITIMCKVFHSRIDIGALHLTYTYGYGIYGEGGWEKITFYTKVPELGTIATEHFGWERGKKPQLPSLKRLIWKLSN